MKFATAERPTCVLFAGPNGAGKSTAYARFLDAGYEAGEYLNPDDVAKRLRQTVGDGSAPEIRAGREIIERIRALIADRQPFVRETTLTSSEVLRSLDAAKRAGYRLVLVFVALSNAGLARGRVCVRVASAGHHIPADVQRRRFPRALANAARAAEVVDVAYFLDNGGVQHRLVATVRRGVVTFLDAAEAAWVRQATVRLPRAPILKSREEALAGLRMDEGLSEELQVREAATAYGAPA